MLIALPGGEIDPTLLGILILLVILYLHWFHFQEMKNN